MLNWALELWALLLTVFSGLWMLFNRIRKASSFRAVFSNICQHIFGYSIYCGFFVLTSNDESPLAGINIPALDRKKVWEYHPDKKIHVGTNVSGGDIWGYVQENTLIQHRLMVPPKARGTVSFLALAGNYTLEVRPLGLCTNSYCKAGTNWTDGTKSRALHQINAHLHVDAQL